jgi:hypothetical protein
MPIVAEYTILNRSGLKSDNSISCGLSQQTQCDDYLTCENFKPKNLIDSETQSPIDSIFPPV